MWWPLGTSTIVNPIFALRNTTMTQCLPSERTMKMTIFRLDAHVSFLVDDILNDFKKKIVFTGQLAEWDFEKPETEYSFIYSHD